MGITKSESQTLMDAASKLKGILCVKRAGSPAALSLAERSHDREPRCTLRPCIASVYSVLCLSSE